MCALIQSDKKQKERKRKVELTKEVRALLSDQQLTDQKIAERLDVSRHTVLRMRKKLGIIKPRGGARPGAGRPRAAAERFANFARSAFAQPVIIKIIKRRDLLMRKSIVAVITLLLALALVVPAAMGSYSYGVNVFVNDTKVVFPDQRPFIDNKNNRTYVPLRFVSEALGAVVDWDGNKQTAIVQRDGSTIEMKAGTNIALVDGKTTTIDAPAMLVNGRTMVPLRFVSEVLGAQVEWKAPNVFIYDEKATAPVEPAQPEGKAIDLTGKGDPFPQPLQKYMASGDKIVWMTYDEFNSNVYKLGTVETYGMRVTKDQVYITQKGGCGSVALYEGGDIFRPRSSSGPPEAREQKWEYGYTVVLDSTDKYGGWPTCDITKVSHIVLSVNETSLGIENPLYKGGK